MRYLIILFFLNSTSIFSQDYVLYKKDGTKIIAEPSSFDLMTIDKRIEYKLPGKTWSKYISYKDLDYAIYGNKIFKSYVLDKYQSGYFLIAEQEGKSLIGIARKENYTEGNMHWSKTFYNMFIIDDKETVLETFISSQYKNDSGATNRTEFLQKIKDNFTNCPDLMERLKDFDKEGEKRTLYFLPFLEDAYYSKCK